jgi:plasmid stability protein
MQETTTVRVTRSTHQELRERAEQDGLTVEAELRQLLRYDRQRRIADALATTAVSATDEQTLRAGAAAVGRNLDASR